MNVGRTAVDTLPYGLQALEYLKCHREELF